MTAAQSGDREAVDQLLRRHYDRIQAVCRRITGNEADAADAAQEAMIAIVRNLARFDGRSTFGTWAYRIATNASLDELRRRRRRPLARSPLGDDHGIGPTMEPVDHNAGIRIDALGDHLALGTALAALAEDYRLPVVLRDVADLDYAEISEVLNIPLGTVKSRIARGRAALAEALGATRHQAGIADGNHASPDQRPTGAP